MMKKMTSFKISVHATMMKRKMQSLMKLSERWRKATRSDFRIDLMGGPNRLLHTEEGQLVDV